MWRFVVFYWTDNELALKNKFPFLPKSYFALNSTQYGYMDMANDRTRAMSKGPIALNMGRYRVRSSDPEQHGARLQG